MSEKKSPFLTYKGKPLVRSGNVLYYGDLADPCVVMLQVQNKGEAVGEVTLSGRVALTLMSTDDSLPADKRILKKSEKEGLYVAMDLASVWLERELERRKGK